MIKKRKYLQIQPEAEIILKNYQLCDSCLGRLFSKRLGVESNKPLGKKIRKSLKTGEHSACFICKNLQDSLEGYISQLLREVSDLQFKSFLIGGILKPSMMDRDDFIRSKYKLQGIENIKTDITRETSKKFSRKTHTKIDKVSPDLTITINFKTSNIEYHTKPVILFGRYTKKIRGLPQKQKKCVNCNGKGCTVCFNHGITEFESIEGRLSKYLYKKLKANQVKFSWIGGEDKSSLVMGTGRPFLVKALSPKIRKTRFEKKIDLDDVFIHGLRFVEDIPKQPPRFKSIIQLLVETEDKITSSDLRILKLVRKSPVQIFEKFQKRTEKKIYQIKYKKNSEYSFTVWLAAEGGFAVKRFVEGPNVDPNLSDLLGKKCRCKLFDFNDIILQ